MTEPNTEDPLINLNSPRGDEDNVLSSEDLGKDLEEETDDDLEEMFGCNSDWTGCFILLIWMVIVAVVAFQCGRH